jgi:hypothetical protein
MTFAVHILNINKTKFLYSISRKTHNVAYTNPGNNIFPCISLREIKKSNSHGVVGLITLMTL